MKLQFTLLQEILHIEPFILISLFILIVYLFYKAFLKNVSAERHRSIRQHFKNLIQWYSFFASCFISYFILSNVFEFTKYKFFIYLGLITYFLGAVVAVKTSRLLLLQYLFFSNIRSGVPILLVNIFTLIISFTIILWSLSYFFKINIAPILATSAAVSLVLGLALQETLGNLFAGISLQFDRSFEIGDWIEVIINNQKIVGQVDEISWRSTTLKGLFNEIITFPNRLLANSQIVNFKKGEIALYRSQIFRVPHNQDLNLVRQVLLNSIKSIRKIRHDLPIFCLMVENHDSWVTFRLSFAIEDYGEQFIIGNEVLEQGIKALQENKIPFAHQIYNIQQQS